MALMRPGGGSPQRIPVAFPFGHNVVRYGRGPKPTSELTSMPQDLRSYLDLIKRRKPDGFVIVSKEVDPAYERKGDRAPLRMS
jgi:hypothetical protein